MNVAVLASGSGTILEAMCAAGVDVSLVVVDRPCRAVKIAAAHQIRGVELIRTEWGTDFDRDTYTRRLTAELQTHQIDLVVMAGFGTILAEPIYDRYAGNILNTHPSLLPAFPGWHAVEAALEYGVKVTGATVHVATLEVDSGPILAQEAVPVHTDDTVTSLHERIKVIERRLYVDTVKSVIERGYVLADRRGKG